MEFHHFYFEKQEIDELYLSDCVATSNFGAMNRRVVIFRGLKKGHYIKSETRLELLDSLG